MSPAPARLIFVVLLVVNCILWSRSHYGPSLQPSSLSHGEYSLVKRISYELSNPPSTRITGDLDDQCRPLGYPTDSQCKHVEEYCAPPATVLSIDYLHHYFCTDVSLRPAAFVGLLIWLFFLFSTLGISASDFFTPNLASIAQLLGLDENVAGVTFLAFGNGSPDLFSTYSAMRTNSGSLAIGELLGAASFIVSCVVGSMCIIRPFRVHPGPFLRDVGFFTGAVALVLVILWDGEIRLWEAGSLIALYMIYVITVMVGTWWERRKEHKRYMESIVRSEYQDDPTAFSEPYRDEPSPTPSQTATLSPTSPTPQRVRAISAPAPPRLQTNLPPRPHSRSPSPSPSSHVMPSFSLIGALEFRDVVAGLRNSAAGSSLSMFESPVTPYAGGHYHSHPVSRTRTPRTSLSSRDADWDAGGNAVPLGERSVPRFVLSPVLSPIQVSEDAGSSRGTEDYFSVVPGNPPRHTAVPSIFRTPASPTASDSAESEVQLYTPPSKWRRIFHVLYRIYYTLFPTLHNFRQQSISSQIARVFAAPAVLLLTLTLPVVVTRYENPHASREKLHSHSTDGRLVDFEEEGVERILIAEEEVEEDMHELAFNKWLMGTQCILGPVFCAKVLFGGSRHELWILLATLITGIATGILVAIFSDRGNHPTARMARCSMGFCVAMVWIMAIADEVVNVLQTFGLIFGLSDAIIGLTIFAVGNSLADLVANMSVAVFAPIMGFSACFGGPMLNILLGVGVSGTYIIQQRAQQPYHLELSTTLFVSSIGLLFLLVSTLVFVPLNDYFLTRRWGILLIASYTIIMTINIIVELKS